MFWCYVALLRHWALYPHDFVLDTSYQHIYLYIYKTNFSLVVGGAKNKHYICINTISFTFFSLGPLIRSWCMRYEAKHHYFKKLSQAIGNFTNLPYTLSMRHQQWVCYKLQSLGIRNHHPSKRDWKLVQVFNLFDDTTHMYSMLVILYAKKTIVNF